MNKDKARKNIGRIILGVLVGIIVLIQFYPLFWIFTSSIKTNEEFTMKPAYTLPSGIYLEHYKKVLFESNIPRYFVNSMIVAFFTLILLALLGSLAGFAFAKMKFKGQNFMFLFIMSGMMIPLFVGIIPLFQVINKLGLRDLYISLILPQVGFGLPVSMFLYIGFMEYIPSEMEESAFLDGASPWLVYSRIIMPMCKNATITVLTFNFISIWNELTFANTFISAQNMRTLPIGLTDFLRGMGTRDWGMTFAAIGTSIIPTLIIYFFLNERMIDGMAAGALKG